MIPFLELTSDKLYLQLQRIKLWSQLHYFLNINNPLVKKDILENYNDFDTLEYVYNESDLFIYISFQTSDMNNVDDYFAIMF